MCNLYSLTPKHQPRAHAGAADARAKFETWLKGSPEEALARAREYPAERMRIVQEGFDKEDLLRAA